MQPELKRYLPRSFLKELNSFMGRSFMTDSNTKCIILKSILYTGQPFRKNRMDKVRAGSSLYIYIYTRKTEGANCTALRIQRQLEHTGSDDCVQTLSLVSTFTISLTRPLCSQSKECSLGEEKEGDECNMYSY